MKAENFITIQGWMRTDLELKGNELLCYALIFGFSQDENSKFTGSLKYVAEWLGSSKSTAQATLKKLVEKDLIQKHDVEVSGVKFCHYSCRTVYRKSVGGVPKIGRGCTENRYGGVPKIGTYNIEDTIEDNIEIDIDTVSDSEKSTENKKPESTQGDDQQKFIDGFNAIKNSKRPYRLGSDLKRKLKGRLKDGYTIDEILTAAKNAMKSSHHRETNFAYITPEFILRPDKLEMYLSFTPAMQKNNSENLIAPKFAKMY